MAVEQAVAEHYTRGDLLGAILTALAAAGKDLDRLTPADLAPIEEFHVRGRAATQELAQRLAPTPRTRVLDLGCGVGGPSRYLAATFGCPVTGVDLTEEYCRAAEAMAAWVGLGDRVSYRRADALALPFDDAAFDVVWTQHVAMNIADKARLYAEVRRVLGPGGRLALYDILQGPGGPPQFPMPWAREPSHSHLITPEELRRRLAEAGFEIESWRDVSAEGRAWIAEVAPRLLGAATPPAALALLLGPDFRPMVENLRRGLEEERIVIVEAVCRRV